MPQADDRAGEHGITVEQLRAGLVQMMRDSHDLIHTLKHITALVFDKSFPWPLVDKLGETGRKCRGLIGPHQLWDLTNDPAIAESIRNALGRAMTPLTDEEAEQAFGDFADLPPMPIEEARQRVAEILKSDSIHSEESDGECFGKEHPYRPVTMRDGSKACGDCYAPPSHPIHTRSAS